MHRIIDLACRRTAGVAAGAVLLGGLAGGVLLTPGTALDSALGQEQNNFLAALFLSGPEKNPVAVGKR